MKIPGNGNGSHRTPGDLHIQKMLFRLHPIFRRPSDYAIKASLARALSQNSKFRILIEHRGYRELDQLAGELHESGLKVNGPGRELVLDLHPCCIVGAQNDFLTYLITDREGSIEVAKDRPPCNVLLQGRIWNARIRTPEDHLTSLLNEGNYAELMMIADDTEGLLDYTLFAIDILIKAPGLPVQKFLLEGSKQENERRSLRCLHALAIRGEAHDLVGRLLEHGNRLIDCFLDPAGNSNAIHEFDFYLVLRSLAAIKTPDHQAAVDLFRNLDPKDERGFSPLQYKVVQMLRNDGHDYTKWLAVSLVGDRLGPILNSLNLPENF